jgi:hypothetical protein
MTARTMIGAGICAFSVMMGAPAWAQGGGAGSAPRGGGGQGTGRTTEGLPPADQPLIPAKIQPIWISFEGGAGVLGYLGGTAALGPAWNVRVAGILSERVAIEGSYLGSLNRRTDSEASLVYTGVDAAVRYNILLADQAPVQPFVAGGLGYAAVLGEYGDATVMTFPLSFGVERLLSPYIKIGARLNVRPAVFDDLGAPHERNPPGADTWSLTVHLGGAF